MTGENPKARLEELRLVLRAENMSYGELAELQSLAEHIEPGDVELLEPAGVPESAVETQELSVSLMLTVRIKAPVEDCEGRPYNAESLVQQIREAIWEDMPFNYEDREPTDLVQELLAVEIYRVGAVNVQGHQTTEGETRV